jgi:hypothetical protein
VKQWHPWTVTERLKAAAPRQGPRGAVSACTQPVSDPLTPVLHTEEIAIVRAISRAYGLRPGTSGLDAFDDGLGRLELTPCRCDPGLALRVRGAGHA